MRFLKSIELLQLSIRRPAEALDRVLAFVEARAEQVLLRRAQYQIGDWQGGLQQMNEALGADLGDLLSEPQLAEIENEVREGIRRIAPDAPFALSHNADFRLAKLCYAVCRLLRPKIVLETGVAYGVNSAFILKALAENQEGLLHSIDLPPLGPMHESYVGALVADSVRKNWILHRGPSKRVMPKLLPMLGSVDLFVHDSLHTYANIRRELGMITPYLAPRAVVVVDDIEGNRAFAEFVERTTTLPHLVAKQDSKSGLFGIAVVVSLRQDSGN